MMAILCRVFVTYSRSQELTDLAQYRQLLAFKNGLFGMPHNDTANSVSKMSDK